MYSTKFSFLRNLGIGLLTLLVTLPLTYAQRQQQFDRGDSGLRNEPNQRSEPARAPMERTPVIVDRPNHGSVRHVDTQAIEHPVEMHRPAVAPSPADVRRNVEIRHEADIRQHVLVHRDVEVDLNRSHFWHGFVFGARFHDLRAGWLRLFVNNSAYFYDDGIYYQHIGDG